MEPDKLLSSAPDEPFLVLAKHRRWDDRKSTLKERQERLSGSDRFCEAARILEGVPMEDYWRDLDFEELHRFYPLLRPHLSRTRHVWDAILPLLAGHLRSLDRCDSRRSASTAALQRIS